AEGAHGASVFEIERSCLEARAEPGCWVTTRLRVRASSEWLRFGSLRRMKSLLVGLLALRGDGMRGRARLGRGIDAGRAIDAGMDAGPPAEDAGPPAPDAASPPDAGDRDA